MHAYSGCIRRDNYSMFATTDPYLLSGIWESDVRKTNDKRYISDFPNRQESEYSLGKG